MEISVLLSEPEIDGNDFVNFLDVISANYRIDAHDKNSMDYKAAMLLFQKAKEKHYRKSDFWKAVDDMLDKQKFPNWTRADFFQSEKAMVYTKEEAYRLSEGTLNGFQRVVMPNISIPIWVKITENIKPPMKLFVCPYKIVPSDEPQ